VLTVACSPGCSSCGSGGDDDSAGDKGVDKDGDSADDDSAEDKSTPVQVVTVTSGPIAELIASSATVDCERRADVLVEAAGVVETVDAEEGGRVAQGQVLATLRNPQLKGELQRAEAAFARAREEFESVRGLYEQGFVARSQHDQAAHAFDTARVTLEEARSSEEARRITSPIAGTLSLRGIRYGEAVSPGKLAFQVVDLGALRVEVNLPEKDLSRLREGQSARARSEVLPGLEVKGSVQRISPVVDPSSGTVKVTIALDPEQTQLRPGMFVHVDVVVDTHEQALLLPKRAVVWDEGEPIAFVVNEGAAKRTTLKLGFAERDTVEVLEGLSAGQQVVTVGQGLLRDGAEVRIVE
jgi:RND family efflux transporter MFP subunit